MMLQRFQQLRIEPPPPPPAATGRQSRHGAGAQLSLPVTRACWCKRRMFNRPIGGARGNGTMTADMRAQKPMQVRTTQLRGW